MGSIQMLGESKSFTKQLSKQHESPVKVAATKRAKRSRKKRAKEPPEKPQIKEVPSMENAYTTFFQDYFLKKVYKEEKKYKVDQDIQNYDQRHLSHIIAVVRNIAGDRQLSDTQQFQLSCWLHHLTRISIDEMKPDNIFEVEKLKGLDPEELTLIRRCNQLVVPKDCSVADRMALFSQELSQIPEIESPKEANMRQNRQYAFGCFRIYQRWRERGADADIASAYDNSQGEIRTLTNWSSILDFVNTFSTVDLLHHKGPTHKDDELSLCGDSDVDDLSDFFLAESSEPDGSESDQDDHTEEVKITMQEIASDIIEEITPTTNNFQVWFTQNLMLLLYLFNIFFIQPFETYLDSLNYALLVIYRLVLNFWFVRKYYEELELLNRNIMEINLMARWHREKSEEAIDNRIKYPTNEQEGIKLILTSLKTQIEERKAQLVSPSIMRIVKTDVLCLKNKIVAGLDRTFDYVKKFNWKVIAKMVGVLAFTAFCFLFRNQISVASKTASVFAWNLIIVSFHLVVKALMQIKLILQKQVHICGKVVSQWYYSIEIATIRLQAFYHEYLVVNATKTLHKTVQHVCDSWDFTTMKLNTMIQEKVMVIARRTALFTNEASTKLLAHADVVLQHTLFLHAKLTIMHIYATLVTASSQTKVYFLKNVVDVMKEEDFDLFEHMTLIFTQLKAQFSPSSLSTKINRLMALILLKSFPPPPPPPSSTLLILLFKAEKFKGLIVGFTGDFSTLINDHYYKFLCYCKIIKPVPKADPSKIPIGILCGYLVAIAKYCSV